MKAFNYYIYYNGLHVPKFEERKRLVENMHVELGHLVRVAFKTR
jgi:hypothetical protein